MRAVTFRELLKNFEPYPYRDFREDIIAGRYQKQGKYSYIGPDGEKYDIRNSLNNLSGRQWTHFLSSVEVTAYPVSGPESYGHELRKKHPSPKPPQLMKRIIEFFTKEGQWVLDPFMGVGGTLLGASLSRRNAFGVDISPEYVSIYREVTKKLGLKEQLTLVDDARNLPKVLDDIGEFFDLILTDPPYFNMQSRPKTGEKAKKTGKKYATPFTGDKRDLGNIEHYPKFLHELRRIIGNLVPYLKKGRYLVVFIKDMQPTADNPHLLHADLIRELSKVPKLEFKGYKIWFDKTQNLYPYGYPFEYVGNIFHQYILIFRKRGKREDPLKPVRVV